MKNKAKDPVQNFPSFGIYQINGKDHWKGMPLPRTEIIDNGTEFYFIKNNNNTITVLNNNPSDLGTAFILDSNTGICQYQINTTPLFRMTLANQARQSSIIFNSPDDSFAVPTDPVFKKLNELSESFKVSNPKDIFPILFNDINYKGSVPNIEYFKGITLLEYNNYKNEFIDKIWDFKNLSIDYCILFCISLYQILSKFQSLIFKTYSLNINNYPTLPSLAFAIFRTHYLKKDSIHQISGDIDRDIRSGYTGGSTDMYIPKPPIGVKIHAYDVNSLYLFVMLNNLYPVGSPTYFEGNILKNNPNVFGFFYCKIVTPDNLKQPILQLHHNNRTVSPLGIFLG
jgi:hypothetical protein